MVVSIGTLYLQISGVPHFVTSSSTLFQEYTSGYNMITSLHLITLSKRNSLRILTRN